MRDPNTPTPTGRHIPFKQEGWGVAAFVVLLAVIAAASAGYVHNKTYKHPTDVRFQAAGEHSQAAH